MLAYNMITVNIIIILQLRTCMQLQDGGNFLSLLAADTQHIAHAYVGPDLTTDSTSARHAPVSHSLCDCA